MVVSFHPRFSVNSRDQDLHSKSVNTTNSVSVMILNKAYSGLSCVISLN